jgi:hypothetical protein
MMKLISFSQIWIHLSAEIAAAVAAAAIFRLNNPSDK